MEALEELMASMSEEGFSKTDYNVMENSCNTFTEAFYPYNLRGHQLTFFQALAVRLGLTEYFPSAVHRQTRLGAILSPLVRNNQSPVMSATTNQSPVLSATANKSPVFVVGQGSGDCHGQVDYKPQVPPPRL